MVDFTPDPTENTPTAPQPSTIEVVPHPDTTTVMHLSGRLDRESAPLAREEIMAAIAEGQPNLILDVADVPSIDGAGATSLLFGMHRAQQAGGDLSIVAPTDSVLQRLELAGLHAVLPIHASVVEALEADVLAGTPYEGSGVHGMVAEAVVREVVGDAPSLTDKQLSRVENAVVKERRSRAQERDTSR